MRKAAGRRRTRAAAKTGKKPSPAAAPERTAHPDEARQGPTLKSRTQFEIRLGHGARPLTATEQAARLASAQMERRIGRLLWRRVKLKFR